MGIAPVKVLHNNIVSVVGNSHVSLQQLFAAFEEDDLKTLQTLTASIRGFRKEGSLKKVVTRDNSRSLLDSLARQRSIHSFDQSSLRRVQPKDKSRPLYAYSLAASAMGEDGGEGRGEEGGGGSVREEGKDDDAESRQLWGEEDSERTIPKRPPSSSGAADRVESAPYPSSISAGSDEVGAAARANCTGSATKQSPSSSLESQSPAPQTAAPASATGLVEYSSGPGEVIQPIKDCEVKVVGSLTDDNTRVSAGGAVDSGRGVDSSPQFSGDNPPCVFGAPGLGAGCGGENGARSQSVTSEISDIFENLNGSDAELPSCPESVTSEVSDIFESEDFKEEEDS